MRVLHVTASFLPARSPSSLHTAVLRLCQGLQQAGVDVAVATTAEAASQHEVEGVPVAAFPQPHPSRYGVSAGLVRHLHRVAGDFDLVHVTGLFTFASAAASRVAQARAVPFVVTPSGMAMPWALRHRGWKKQPYWRTVERPGLSRARALHATSELEAEELRGLGLGPTVFVVPNAVARPADRTWEGRPNRVLFLGRLHPIKRLDLLIEAMSVLTRRRPDVELLVAGTDREGLWPQLLQQSAQLRPRPRVQYLGHVEGEQKARLMASAGALALTSHRESFGLVVAEALAHGTPVVTTTGCPWAELQTAGAGRWVEPHPEAIAAALDDVLTAGRTMSERARAVARRFEPGPVSAQMANHYDRLLARDL